MPVSAPTKEEGDELSVILILVETYKTRTTVEYKISAMPLCVPAK